MEAKLKYSNVYFNEKLALGFVGSIWNCFSPTLNMSFSMGASFDEALIVLPDESMKLGKMTSFFLELGFISVKINLTYLYKTLSNEEVLEYADLT
jgi:hypothetical protein